MQQMYAVVYKVFDLCGNENTNKMLNEWRRSVWRQQQLFSVCVFFSSCTFSSHTSECIAWEHLSLTPFFTLCLYCSLSDVCLFFFPRNLFHSVFFHFVRLSLIVLYGASCALERFFSHSIYRFISLVILFFIWNVIVVDLSKNPTKKCFAFFLSDKYKKAHNVRMLYAIVRKKKWYRQLISWIQTSFNAILTMQSKSL